MASHFDVWNIEFPGWMLSQPTWINALLRNMTLTLSHYTFQQAREISFKEPIGTRKKYLKNLPLLLNGAWRVAAWNSAPAPERSNCTARPSTIAAGRQCPAVARSWVGANPVMAYTPKGWCQRVGKLEDMGETSSHQAGKTEIGIDFWGLR